MDGAEALSSQAEHLRPTALEIAAGAMFGDEPEAPVAESDPSLAPRAALEELVRAALEPGPCLVTLSGGRDSSAVLAVAAHVARREGLPLPVPITVRFHAAPGTGEAEWQDLVVRHLALEEWVVLDVDDELDLVGPVSARLLARHGILYPAHACLFALMVEHARGGSLLTGVGGDSIFGSWRYWTLLDSLAARRRPDRGDVEAAAHLLAPGPVRRAVARARAPSRPWLSPEAERLVEAQIGASAARAPRSWSAHLASRLRARAFVATLATLRLLGEAEAAVASDPLSDSSFVAALARAGGKTGLGSRTAIMQKLFGDLLPESLVVRADKARFPFAYFRAPSRAFAASWSGQGLDPALVDAERLRATWLELLPNGYTALAIQQAWLASGGGDAGEQLPRLVQEVEATGPP